MNKPFFLCKSITYAMRSRDILLHHHIAAYVERSRKGRARHGCGYGVYVPKKTEQALQILQEHRIPILERMEWEEGSQ